MNIFKYLLLLIVFVLISACNSLVQEEHRIDNHKLIGSHVIFYQPIVYVIYKKTNPLVNIVNKFEKKLGHIKVYSSKSEKYDGPYYIPSDTEFMITDVYYYKNLFNSASTYIVLEDLKKNKYITGFSIEDFAEPLNIDRYGPIKLFDELYDSKKSIKIKLIAEQGYYPDSSSKFSKCTSNFNKVSKNTYELEVNLDILMCLYEYLWDNYEYRNNDIYIIY